MVTQIAINAHLLSAQQGYRSAGIHGYIYHTLKHLPQVRPDWDFHVLVGEGDPPSQERIHVHRSTWRTSSPLKRIVWEQMLQPGQLRRLKPNVYHAMAFVSPLWGVSMPSVVTVYDLSFLHYPGALSRGRRLYLQAFTRQSCQQAGCIIAISQSTAEDIVEWLDIDPEKIVVAVPGVGDEFRPLPDDVVAHFRREKGLPNRYILHLGTLEPRKNLPMLLEAYARLPNALREDVHLVLAGGKGWDYTPIFQTINRFQLSDQVHLPGYVHSGELPFWYNAATCFVYPSIYEGWGLPVIEAMASGCPTLISDVSSLPEAAGDTGKRLPPTDPAAWYAALEQVLTDAEWRQQSREQGMQRAKHFTWQATAEATIHAYQQAMR